MIKAIIFDLDNCLAPASEVGHHLYEPAFAAIRRANHNSLSREALDEAFSDCWRHPLDWVAAKYGFSEEMLASGWQLFATLEVKKPMTGYADLPVLSELPGQLFLVTSGFRRLQASKIRALGLERWFTAMYIDAIDEPDRRGKQEIFEHIVKTQQLRPEELLIVGDNPDSEIHAGNRLGIRTVQILRPGVPRGDNATFYVHTLVELKELLRNID